MLNRERSIKADAKVINHTLHKEMKWCIGSQKHLMISIMIRVSPGKQQPCIIRCSASFIKIIMLSSMIIYLDWVIMVLIYFSTVTSILMLTQVYSKMKIFQIMTILMDKGVSKTQNGSFLQETIDHSLLSKAIKCISLHWGTQADTPTIFVFQISNLHKEISIGLKMRINHLGW